MGDENFTTYTEVDPNTRITKIASRVSWVEITRAEDAYVYKDKEAAYFDGDFTHYFTFCSVSLTAPYGQATNIAIPWALSNTVGSRQDVLDASGDEIGLYARIYGTGDITKLLLFEVYSGSPAQSSELEISGNTPYYLKIVRDEAVGDYGTLYCYIYSDSARTTLVGTLTRTLHEAKKDFRYIYALQSLGYHAVGFDHSGYTENLDLAPIAPFIPKIMMF